MEQPNRFIRPIHESDLLRMELPSAFAAIYSDKAVKEVKLRFEDCQWSRNVSIGKHDGKMFIEGSGWKRILELYRVQPGYSMQFEYLENEAVFKVDVFNANNIRLQDTHTEFRLGNKVRPVICPRPDPVGSIRSTEGLVVSGPHSIPVINLDSDTSSSDGGGLAVEPMKTKKKGRKGRGKTGPSAPAAVKKRRRTTILAPVCHVRAPPVKAHESVAYLQAVAENPPSDKCCSIIMQNSYLRRGKNLVIPEGFSALNICEESTVRTFRCPPSPDLDVECAFYGDKYGRAKASTWNTFVARHSLAIGDVLVITVNTRNESIWDVAIYRAA